MPAQLFRYFTPDAVEIFSNRRLRFSSANRFNDPFEFAPRCHELVSDQVEQAKKVAFVFSPNYKNWNRFDKTLSQKLGADYAQRQSLELSQELQDAFSTDFGLLCFSANITSPAMWGHYTEMHKGFAIGFNGSHCIFQQLACKSVAYSDERPTMHASKEEQLVFSKGTEWSYEKEYRIAAHRSDLEKRADYNKENASIEIPFDFVDSVYLGLRINATEKDRILFQLQSKEWKHVKIYQMERHLTKYSLEPKLIS